MRGPWVAAVLVTALGVLAWRLDSPWKTETIPIRPTASPERARDATPAPAREPARKTAMEGDPPPAPGPPVPAPASGPAPAAPRAPAEPAAAAPLTDSRVEAELRQLEEQAARAIEAEERRRALPARAVDADTDSWRESGATAYLVDRIVQEALAGTEYPLGYPALAREIDAAVSHVTALDARQRRDLLDALLQRNDGARVAPRFSTLLWEGTTDAPSAVAPDGR